MANAPALTEKIAQNLSRKGLLQQCSPWARVLLLSTLALVWYLQDASFVLIYVLVLILLCVVAPFNPVRPRILAYPAIVAILAWLFQRYRGVSYAMSVETALLMSAKIFVLVAAALLFVTILDTWSLLRMTSQVPVLNRFSPAVVAFLRLAPHVRWITQRASETAQVRGFGFFLRHPLSSAGHFGVVCTPYVIALLHFLGDYSDVLALRGFSTGIMEFEETPSSVLLSWTIYVICAVLWLIALKDFGLY